MVLSGSKTEKFTNNNAFNLEMEWSGKQNIPGNYTDITVKVYIRANYSWSVIQCGSSLRDIRISCNGVNYNHKMTFNFNGTGRQLVFDKVCRVAHTANGTKQVNIAAHFWPNIYWNGRNEPGPISAGANYALNDIPRATIPTCASSTDMGKQVIINLPRAYGSFTHKVYYEFLGVKKLLSSNAGATYTFNPSIDEYAPKLPNSTKNGGIIHVETYLGSSKVGSNSCSLTLLVPASLVPTISATTFTELNTNVSTVLGANTTFVQGKSNIRMNTTAAGAKGSTITNFDRTVGGKSYNNYGYLCDADLTKDNIGTGTITAKITVKDSRGRTATKSFTFTVLPYKNPQISNVLVERTDEGRGQAVTVASSGIVSSLKMGTVEKNPYTVKLESKENSDAATWKTILTVENGFINKTETDPIDGYLSTSSYQFRLTVSDKFSSASKTSNISTTIALLHLAEDKGVGIGKMWEYGDLNVAKQITIGSKNPRFENEPLMQNSCMVFPEFLVDDQSAIHLSNGDLIGVNHVRFNDECDRDNAEGLLWPKGAPSTEKFDKSDFIVEKINGSGQKFLNSNHIYTYNSGVGIAYPVSHLWSGAQYMHSTHTVTPTKPISKCRNGWILMWSKYESGTQTFADMVEVYVSKSIVSTKAGGGIRMLFGGYGSTVVHKYLSIHDTKIVGNDINDDANTNGNRAVLTRVHEW
ncbi:hypothetical protein I4L69_001649 [Enterococcus faecium]|nr:hypothetical protein [Enterococcus faecium]